ncbi:IclR family transcriptional regulator [Maledivibacter halophilus]|uniref:Transcriptional regulator, IclR family n=1 Tax=Maledivibacter halophilus TaxID=36842 RepID=A0A1T5MDG9_9FIRM|nr:IclR family transcriptional regulator [Maledivibacter halophilus]SKC86133.1 transcriptional regulator, IclR family [Maledivibacter halophilus]
MGDYVQSVIKVGKILELFDKDRDELGIVEIRDHLGYPVSTIHRLISTLEHMGYIYQNEKNNKYSLGFKAYVLGSKVKIINHLKEVSKPYLDELSNKYGETVHLAINMNNKVLCVQKTSTNRTLTVTPGEGGTHYIHATSVGKSLLAFSDKEKTEKFIEGTDFVKLTQKTITDKEELKEELEKIRKNKVAVDMEESEIGLICIGAPILSRSGKAIAAISLSIPDSRLTHNIEELKKNVQITANKIAHKLYS